MKDWISKHIDSFDVVDDRGTVYVIRVYERTPVFSTIHPEPPVFGQPERIYLMPNSSHAQMQVDGTLFGNGKRLRRRDE